MNKKLFLIIFITIVFIAVLGVFEWIHRQVDVEVGEVPAQYLQPIDASLKTDFIEQLEQRQGNNLGSDLGY